jgi:hypothetical protein
MSTLIRLNPTRWPYSLNQLRLDEPSRSFSPDPSDAELAHYGVFRVQPTQPPEPDPAIERVVEIAPVEADGVWLQQWGLVELSDGEKAAYQLAQNPPQWVAFGEVVMETPEIKALLNQAMALGESPLAMGLAVGLGKAADGDNRVFLGTWTKARGAGLISAELIAKLQAAGATYHLPAEFIAALGAELP